MDLKSFIDREISLFHSPNIIKSHNPTNIGYLRCLEYIKKCIEKGHISGLLTYEDIKCPYCHEKDSIEFSDTEDLSLPDNATEKWYCDKCQKHFYVEYKLYLNAVEKEEIYNGDRS